MIYDKINLMIPTYKRVKELDALIKSVMETAKDLSNVFFTFCINRKDCETRDYLIDAMNGKEPFSRFNIIYENTEQPNLAHYYNLMYQETAFKGENVLVSMIGDDMLFLSSGWDERILGEVNKRDGKIVLWCNDMLAGKKSTACINLFTTRKMVDASKHPFMCDLFHADMIDVVWWHVGTCTSTLVYLDDVILKHNHNTLKPKQEWDETFKRIHPVQLACRTEENQRKAIQYATIVAGDLIAEGIGQWNKL